jgi:5,10-methenyltetrahydrofolate synthetase
MTEPNPAPELESGRPARIPDDTQRAALRRARIAARMALSATEHQQLSQQIEAHLQTLLARHRPRTLGFCWPYRAEFDCRPLVTRLLAADSSLRAALPVVCAADQTMEFRSWTADSVMQPDRYGILYPSAGQTLIPDVLLIPLNAFDAQGYRLGYGSGYFDRTLAKLDPAPLTIGIGFELARVASIHPASHDIPLDVIVTETGISYFAARFSTDTKKTGAF